MNVNLSELAPWVAVAVSIGSLVYAILNGRTKKIDEEIAAINRGNKESYDSVAIRFAGVKAEVDQVKDRLTRVEADMAHLPDKDVTHRLEMALASMQTEMRGLNEKVKPIAAMADRIQEAMLEKVMS
ncbi:DUF2730 family protein [Bradyrhizobium ontarionense]|uniref:DUF2730 family protein n=1 Tax=Bradyrhizobium ontarionense TaxID=2898149 RepID=A0ABY3RFJ4_9BRAD|nr:DUF2730 family protein [Bradyrhizobium sp. A19]UFZ05493.1 DUF2730 family protein [Bradyrhizobium sp. A19]